MTQTQRILAGQAKRAAQQRERMAERAAHLAALEAAPEPRPVGGEYRLVNCLALAAQIIDTKAARRWAYENAHIAARYDADREEARKG